MFRRYFESSVEIPGPAVDAMSAAARDHGVHLVIGVIERERGTLYCTVLFFAPDGALLGKHRKLMPTAMERLVWGMGDGSTMPVYDTSAGKIGAVICWENYMPLLRMAMYAKGVNIWCAPTVDDRDVWLATMRHIAVEGRCFVLSACQFLRRSQCPEDYHAIQGDEPETILISGGSVIVSPLGDVLQGPLRGEEGLLVAEFDEKDVIRGKYDLDVVGHYARPDVFHLSVDEAAKSTVSYAPRTTTLEQPESRVPPEPASPAPS